MEQIPCAGAVVLDHAGQILLIRRGTPPGEGLWSVPGGRCEPGESPSAACVREAREESGLFVHVERELGTVLRPGRVPGSEYVITDYLCRVTGGTLLAGDDASAVRWSDPDDLATRPLTPGLLEALVEWGIVDELMRDGERR